MSIFLLEKKKLLEDVFEKAKNNTYETSFSGILKDLEIDLRDKFKIQLSYKTFETYYKSVVKNSKDLTIKPSTLNDLSRYLEYENFKNFCEKNPILDQTSSIKVSIDGKEETSAIKNFSDIIINITNSPIFTIPEFVTRHKNSLGLVGIFIVFGFLLKKSDYFQENKVNQVKSIADLKKNEKECMYWNGEKYIPVFCDENKAGFHIEQLDPDKLKLMKITQPDTLNAKNALGKVWYDKTNNKVEFFTHYGKNPENGKTLKDLTEVILEKYAH